MWRARVYDAPFRRHSTPNAPYLQHHIKWRVRVLTFQLLIQDRQQLVREEVSLFDGLEDILGGDGFDASVDSDVVGAALKREAGSTSWAI